MNLLAIVELIPDDVCQRDNAEDNYLRFIVRSEVCETYEQRFIIKKEKKRKIQSESEVHQVY